VNVAFINPNMSDFKSKDVLPPLWAGILSALTPEIWHKQLFDDRIESIPLNTKFDVVAISVQTFTAQRAYFLAKKFRDNGCKIVLGGFHVTAVPNEAQEHADAIVIGDAEDTWPEILVDVAQNNLKKIYKSAFKFNIVSPDYKIFKDKKYFPLGLIQWSRGCKHNCEFCSIKSFYNNLILIKPLDQIISEIIKSPHKTFLFTDDNLFQDKAQFINLLHALIPLKIQWACQISAQVATDNDLLHLMKKSGCFMVLIGIESFDNRNLSQMNKKWNTIITEKQLIKKFKSHNIMVYGTYIFGYDNDTETSFNQAIKFSIKNGFFLANFNPLYPMPATKLYSRMILNKQLIDENWWLLPGFYYGKSIFNPVKISSNQLEMYCYNAKKKFNSLYSLAIRTMKNAYLLFHPVKLVLFVSINLINRREIYNKQGKTLGTNK